MNSYLTIKPKPQHVLREAVFGYGIVLRMIINLVNIDISHLMSYIHDIITKHPMEDGAKSCCTGL